MPHRAIIGQTGSGKTFAAQRFAAAGKASAISVLVLHKPLETWPAASYSWQTDDPEKFLWKFDRCRSCLCFMELADALVDKYDKRFWRCFTQGRHLGHRCFYLTQRGELVHPNIRDNCESLCLFAVSGPAAKVWAESFNDPALLGAVTLQPHRFFFKPDRYTPARLLMLDP